MKPLILILLCSILITPMLLCQDSIVNQEQQIRKLAHKIEVDHRYENGNWDEILQAIGEKNLVLLGELNHGSKEIFVTRNDLIKELHKKLQFDLILFESGIGEVGTIEINKEILTDQQMTYGFFGGWRTEEFKNLMSYSKKNKITVAGFDVQRTGSGFNVLLKKVSANNSLDTSLYHNIELRFNQQKRLLSNRKAVYDSLKHSTNQLIRDYEVLISMLENNEIDKDKEAGLLVLHTLLNRIKYLQYFLDFTRTGDWNTRWKERDQMMASNIEFLVENLYPGRKAIIIAHNFHIAKFNEKEEVMGEFLLEKYGPEMYVIGVFAGSWSYADNSGKEKEMKPAKEGNDIKHAIRSLDGKVHFIDIPRNDPGACTFLTDHVTINDTFIDLYGSNKMVLSKHFDGLLLFDKISTPDK